MVGSALTTGPAIEIAIGRAQLLPVLVPHRAPAAYLLTGGAVAASALVSELKEQPAGAGAEIRIALVGALTSLALAGLCCGVAWANTWLGAPAPDRRGPVLARNHESLAGCVQHAPRQPAGR